MEQWNETGYAVDREAAEAQVRRAQPRILPYTHANHTARGSGRIAARSGKIALMARLLRKSATLIAIYAIALQALLWGFAPAGHFELDPLAVICTGDGSGDHQPAPGQHRSDCDACLAACSGSPALLPADAAFAPILFVQPPNRLAVLSPPLALHPRHQPQASRAPPMAS